MNASFLGKPGPVEGHTGLGAVLHTACSISYLYKQKRNQVSRSAETRWLKRSDRLFRGSERGTRDPPTHTPQGARGAFPEHGEHATAQQHPLGGAADKVHPPGFYAANTQRSQHGTHEFVTHFQL